MQKAELREMPSCPQCAVGIGVAFKVTATHGVIIATFHCDTCGHEWDLSRIDPDNPDRHAHAAA
jgi:hypothetical protein